MLVDFKKKLKKKKIANSHLEHPQSIDTIIKLEHVVITQNILSFQSSYYWNSSKYKWKPENIWTDCTSNCINFSID